MKQNIYNILKLLFIMIMSMSTSSLAAQSSGDKLYSQGLELQKKQTVQSQRSAISKFQSAKKLYDSAAKKKQCDDAIAVSNNIIKTITANKGQRHAGQKNNAEVLKASVLELSNEKLQLDFERRTVTVNITTTEKDWSITPISNSDGSAFVSTHKNEEEQSFEITCTTNNSTKARTQIIEVKAGSLKKELVVQQSGKPTVLSVEKAVVEFSSKGGSKSIEVYSNSDSIEEENNGRNWKVVSKPEWVNIIGEKYKGKGFFGRLGDKAKEIVGKNSTNEEDSSVITSIMKIVAASKPKNGTSRSGEIVISSEDQQATIIIQQK